MATDLRQNNSESTIHVNTFTKGMNTDTAYDFMSNDLYLFGKNIRILNNSILYGDEYLNNVNGSVAPVPYGIDINLLFKDISDLNGSNGTNGEITKKWWTGIGTFTENCKHVPASILASKSVDNIGAVIIKYENESNEGAYWRVFRAIYDEGNVILTYIYQSKSTTTKNSFSVAINKETSDLTKLYIADGVHGIIIINLTESDLNYYTTLTENELSSNRIYPLTAPVFVSKISGTLKTSLVQYAYRLYKKYGACSKMSPLTHKIQVISNSRLTDIGNEEDTQSSVGFRLKINIDNRHAFLYDKIQIYRISYIKYGEEPTCELIWDAKFDKTDYIADQQTVVPFYVSDNGLKALEEYTIDEFNLISGLSIVPQLIEYNQQYMFAGDIKDETIIKIEDSELDMSAISCNSSGKIILYSDASYSNPETYTSFNLWKQSTTKKGYIHKHTDMSSRDYYNINYSDECVYVPDLSKILGGKGHNVEWRFIVRQTPIHEDVYIEKISDETYDADTAKVWGYTKKNVNFDKSKYITDVPKVTSSLDILYKYLSCPGINILALSASDNTLKDSCYLRQHLIEVTDRTNSFDDIFTSSMFRSLLRGETYRYGVVFYDKDGNRTDAKWIADIRTPSEKDFALTSFSGGTLYANELGVQFIINIPQSIKNKYNIVLYEIVRCKKTPEYSKSLILVATSRPINQKLFSLDEGKETLYYPNYPSSILTTDPYQIGFKLNKYQGMDYASCSEINNYHRGTDNLTHSLDFLLLFSPEIQYRRLDSLDLLLGSNISLKLVRYHHCNYSLNDYDVLLRCDTEYRDGNIWGGDGFDHSKFKPSLDFNFTEDDGTLSVHNRCLTYGQCVHVGTDTTTSSQELSLCVIYPYCQYQTAKNELKSSTLPNEWYDDNHPFEYIANQIYDDHDYMDKYRDSVYSNAKWAINNILLSSSKNQIMSLSDAYLIINNLQKDKPDVRLRMYTPYPVFNRAYIENNNDVKLTQCYIFKDYYCSYSQDYSINKWKENDVLYDKYYVSGNQEIQIDSVSDVQSPLWEDGYDEIELTASIVDTAVKKYKTYLSSVGNRTYCNWACGGLYNYRAGQNDTVSRITNNYNGDKNGYSRIQHFYSPSAEAAKDDDYKPGGLKWGDETGTSDNNGGSTGIWTYPSKDLRWNNAWFGPGPVCFIAKLKSDFGKMDFKYGLLIMRGLKFPFTHVGEYTGDGLSIMLSGQYFYNLIKDSAPTAYNHAYFSSFGTWVCNITHTAVNFAGITKQEKYYDTYVGFGNIVNIDEHQCVFDGDTYILPCEFTTLFKTYNKNSVSTLNSQLFVYYIPMETKINVCFDYGMNYRNSKSPNLLLEPGDMEGVASLDRPLYQYNYIYSDNNNSIKTYIANYDDNEITHIEHRIIYSDPKTNSEDIDQWNTFKAANFIDADSHYGKLTCMFTVKSILYFWQTRAFGKLNVNERSLVTDQNENTITLGTGGVVQRTDYIDTNYGMKEDDLCVVNAENNIYWLDRTNKAFVTCQLNQAYSLGEVHGVQNMIYTKLDQSYLPLIHYDANTKEILIRCLKDKELLVYSTKAKVFTSVYTRKYNEMFNFNNQLYSIVIKSDKSTKYNFLDIVDYTDTEYLHPMQLQFVVNPTSSYTKIFDNLKIVTVNRKKYDSISFNYPTNYMLNKLYLFATDIHKSHTNSDSLLITDAEGNILYSIPRWGNNEYGNRLNGKWMVVNFDMMKEYQNDGVIKYKLDDDRPISQVITKFRRSFV